MHASDTNRTNIHDLSFSSSEGIPAVERYVRMEKNSRVKNPALLTEGISFNTRKIFVQEAKLKRERPHVILLEEKRYMEERYSRIEREYRIQ